MTLYAACLYLIYKSTKNYKKSIFMFLAVFCFMTRNVRVVFIPLSTITISWFMFLFLLNKRKYKDRIDRFPWKLPMLFWAISITASSILSITGFASEISTLLGNLLKQIGLILIIWCVIESKEDFYKVYRYLSIVFFVSCIYGFLEYALQSNPLQTYLSMFSGVSNKVIWTYDATSTRGYRISSIFEHAIGAAINWSMYAVFTIYLYIRRYKEFRHKLFNLLTAILCIVCTFLTKCRSPLLFLAIATIILLIQFNRKKFWKLLVLLAPAIIYGVYIALTQSKALQSVISIVFFGGTGEMGVDSSSLTLRNTQIATAFNLMKISPIFGLGTHYQEVLPSSVTFFILGGESILISVPPAYGIIGLIAYGIMFLFDCLVIPIRYRSSESCILGFAYWLTQMFSTIPGVLTFIYYLFMIYFIKIDGEWCDSMIE